MVTCPACWGEGWHDFRDTDAVLGEHLPDEKIRVLRQRPGWRGFVRCSCCAGTGEVTEDHAADMRAAAVAFVDQVKARYDDMTDEERRRL